MGDRRTKKTMNRQWTYGLATLRGLLRTGYVIAEAGPYAGVLQTPIFLTLIDPVDINPDPEAERESYWAHGRQNIEEVHIVPTADDSGRYPVFDPYVGSIVEITGELFPGHTAHHFRSALLTCNSSSIRSIEPFGLEAVPGSKVLSHGSGIIINDSGHILTAHHVIHGKAYSVRRGLQRAEAYVVAVHPDLDVAVLHCDALRAREVPLRVVLPPQLGEVVFACGYPLRPFLGHSLSITSGLVSSLAASGGQSIWVSAPIQKGNSGGPVFDEFGNVLALINNRLSSIGLNALMARQGLSTDAQDGLQLMNFALPAVEFTDFLRANKIPYLSSSFLTADLKEATPMRASSIASQARLLCVEVESWEVVDSV